MSKQDTTSHLCVAGWMSAVLSEPDKVPSLKEEQRTVFFTLSLWQVGSKERGTPRGRWVTQLMRKNLIGHFEYDRQKVPITFWGFFVLFFCKWLIFTRVFYAYFPQINMLNKTDLGNIPSAMSGCIKVSSVYFINVPKTASLIASLIHRSRCPLWKLKISRSINLSITSLHANICDLILPSLGKVG